MKIIDVKFAGFTSNQETINHRLRGKITRQEYIGLLVAAGFTFIFLWNMHHHKIGAVDMIYSYLPAGRGDFSEFRYPYWIVPVFSLLEKLPFLAGYGIWMLLNILGIFFAARVFGGKTILTLTSYQMLYVLYYGQITGLLAFGLALAWWGMANKHWHLAGLGFLLASTKPQVGFILGLLLFLYVDLSWSERAQVLILPFTVSILSLFIWPGWPQDILSTLRENPLNRNGDFSLWQWFGPWSLLLFLPPLLISIKAKQKVFLVFAGFMLSFPYFQHTGLLLLFCFPTGLLPILGYIGILKGFISWTALKMLVVIPLVLYCALLWDHYKGTGWRTVASVFLPNQQ